ncbi:MAG: 5-carboxymethyl-2-hydroxymuconate delta-isomerase [Bacillota bacterium]|nr:MAG: 5-carboxymethyl-2-hydroxymuconate delta-isomerase [Bacillota bacterium]MBS3949151.1 fumarylacetoacetate hydrolase family protein [Peptococcaceae bacterium]
MTKKYVRFRVNDKVHYGVIGGSSINVLAGDLFDKHNVTDVVYSLDAVRLLTPCEPVKIVCVGLNYRKHAVEIGMALPTNPVLFIKPATTLLEPSGEIVYWPMVGQLDYEGELTVVMGKKCHMVDEATALEYVFGYTIANDMTARDLQRKDGQWTRAKSFDTFLPLGPSIVTGIDASDLSLQTYVNGEIRQDGRTSDLIFPIAYLVSFISQIMTLEPGDVILTGTPSGIGALQVGDEVEVRIEGLGALRNRVVATRGS